MLDLLKQLCTLDGTSGREAAVREFLISQLNGAPYRVDAMGNLIVEVKGRKPAKNRMMLCAHMDEVGVMATFIKADGTVKFNTVGGVSPAVLPGRAFRFESGAVGVVSVKPVHLCSEEEKSTLPDAADMAIDIGADSREQAEALVRPGDTAVFTSEYTPMGDKILSKALDDRAGCAILLDMIRTGVAYDTVFCFNAQEEVGLRGAVVSAFSVAPDYALVLEATTAADIIDAPEEKQVCALGKGPAVSFMDNATVYDKALFQKALTLAAENGIPAQPKTMVAGGNDAGSIHKSRAGVRTLTVSVPCRYIHSASCVCDKNDVLATRRLAEAINEYFAMA
ncbi:MAG: M42 family peptidase [Clostridia bacterium]|nr:M42 family peptidase [Clostridia bacterium]